MSDELFRPYRARDYVGALPAPSAWAATLWAFSPELSVARRERRNGGTVLERGIHSTCFALIAVRRNEFRAPKTRRVGRARCSMFDVRCQANAPKCSAELNSAVSPICNRLAVAEHGAVTIFAIPQNAILRYSRLQICATIGRLSREADGFAMAGCSMFP